VAPAALLARITREQAARLDRLEDAMADFGSEGEPAIVPFRGSAEFEALTLRTAVRAPMVAFLGPPELLEALAPIWRARAASSRQTRLYSVGEAPSPLPFPPEGTVPASDVMRLFGVEVAALLSDDAGIVARLDLPEPAGLWFSNVLLTGMLQAAFAAVTT
jgi:hypothetical protein